MILSFQLVYPLQADFKLFTYCRIQVKAHQHRAPPGGSKRRGDGDHGSGISRLRPYVSCQQLNLRQGLRQDRFMQSTFGYLAGGQDQDLTDQLTTQHLVEVVYRHHSATLRRCPLWMHTQRGAAWKEEKIVLFKDEPREACSRNVNLATKKPSLHSSGNLLKTSTTATKPSGKQHKTSSRPSSTLEITATLTTATFYEPSSWAIMRA